MVKICTYIFNVYNVNYISLYDIMYLTNSLLTGSSLYYILLVLETVLHECLM